MKYLIITSVSFLILINLSCKDKGVNPGDNYPPGYQHDIPWPSLADSPWPMAYHDPQNTGRSQFIGPMNNSVQIIFNEKGKREIDGGIVIDTDGSILFTTTSDSGNVIIKLSEEGEIIFEKSLESSFENAGTPLLTGNKIISLNGFNKIFCFDSIGNVIWTYESVGKIFNKTSSIDKYGNLYFTNILHKMQVLNPGGQLIWEITDPRINSLAVVYNLSFSPDGKTVYLPGQGVSVIAVDIEKRNIKWTFGYNTVAESIVVDVEGNLYFIQDSWPRSKIVSLQSDGTKRWEHSFSGSGANSKPCIDYNGYTYFGSDSLYSVDYKGNLRWKIDLNGYISCNIVCDLENSVYLITYNSEDQSIFQKIDHEGILIWERILNGYIYSPNSFAVGNQIIFIPSRSGIIYSIK
ncbi:MAG: PQQ-binding-like beta-propeller repeat protein [Bacteroidetes bacterium]|nr:PQQ-binding-like beta-propeller repeat protein [Bacteroidota bacterium]